MRVPQHGRVDTGIADATLYILRTGGPRSVTIQAVAERSGIAKTTIYRRHSDRRDMLSAALSDMTSLTPLDSKATPPDRLRWLIREAVSAVEGGIGFGGFAALLTDDDPEFTTVFRQILARQRAELSAAVDAGKGDGGVRADIDGETLVDAIVGAYIAERARTGSVTDGWEMRLFDLFWPVVRT